MMTENDRQSESKQEKENNSNGIVTFLFHICTKFLFK